MLNIVVIIMTFINKLIYTQEKNEFSTNEKMGTRLYKSLLQYLDNQSGS